MTEPSSPRLVFIALSDDGGFFLAMWFDEPIVARGEWRAPAYAGVVRPSETPESATAHIASTLLRGAPFVVQSLPPEFALAAQRAARGRAPWPVEPSRRVKPPKWKEEWRYLEEERASRRGANATAWTEVLGVDVGASDAEVKAAFRRLAREHHPDQGGDAATFQRVLAAYEAAKRRESTPMRAI